MQNLNEHPFSKKRIEVSSSLHDMLMQAPALAKKEKRQTGFFAIVTILCLTLNLLYFNSRQEKLAKEELLETQYANFGSNLSI